MKTYLRFTPQEYEAIVKVCRPVDLGDDFFPIFKYFLVESLKDPSPGLAGRIAQLRRGEVGIIFEHLKSKRRLAAGRACRQVGEADPDLTDQEWQAVARASRAFDLPADFLHSYRAFLVGHFRHSLPELAHKLTRFSDRQMERVYARLRTGHGQS